MRDWDFFLLPYSGSDRGLSLELKLEREGDVLGFTYRLEGRRLGEVVTPRPTKVMVKSGERQDELWKRTCFEFFLGAANSSDYFELNLNTLGDWNAYAFSNYREGMRPVSGLTATPLQEVRSSDDVLELKGQIKLAEFPLLGPVVLGATAVLEYQDGTKDYWALAHRGEKPDFHLRSSFIAKV